MTIDATAVTAFGPGTRVFHQKFGYGTVTAAEGEKLTIDFEKAGPKNGAQATAAISVDPVGGVSGFGTSPVATARRPTTGLNGSGMAAISAYSQI